MYCRERDYQKVESEKYEYASHNPIDYRDYVIGHEAFQFCCYGTFYYVHGKYGQQNADEERYLLAAFIVAHRNVYGYEPENPYSGVCYVEDETFENIL